MEDPLSKLLSLSGVRKRDEKAEMKKKMSQSLKVKLYPPISFSFSELNALSLFEIELKQNPFTTLKYSSKGYPRIIYKGPD